MADRKTPLVSVVTPTFNSAAHLRACLDSVAAQTFQDFEVVIVDDGSTDGTLNIIRAFGDRIRLVSRRRPKRLPTPELARYEGIMEAKGTWCAFIDADDAWRPEKLAKQLQFMEAHPDTPLCHSYVQVVDNQDRPLHIRHEGKIPETGFCARELLHHCFISTSSVLARRDAWLACFQPADFGFCPHEWHFFIQIARRHMIGFLPEVLADYRYQESSHSRTVWRMTPRSVDAMAWILKRRLWEGVITRREMVEILVEACLENAQYWRDRNRSGRAVYFASRALARQPWRVGAWSQFLRSAVKPLSLLTQWNTRST